MQLVKYLWISTLLSFAGFTLGIYPEISVVILLIGSLIAFFQKRNTFTFILVGRNAFVFIFVFFLIVRIILAWQSSNIWHGLLESVAAVLILFSIFWLSQVRQHLKFLTFSIFASLVLIAILNITPRLAFAFQGGMLQWASDTTLVQETRIGEVSAFQAITSNAWVLQNLVMQGSGRIRYQVEVRAEAAFQTSIGVIQSTLSNGRTDRPCLVTVNWTTCFVEVNLPSRDWTQLVVGGFGTWNLDSPLLETKNAEIVVLQPPQIFDVLTDSSRIAGNSFNFNAFGAQVAVISLVAIAVTPNFFWIALTIFPTLVCIFLSGSRGALVAFGFGLLVFFVTCSRFYKILPWLLVFAVFGIASLQVATIRDSSATSTLQSPVNLRSLNVVDKDSARGRLEIWRLATKSWLENPRTFLIGTGDLSQAMRARFDARSSSFGLTKDSLTHAHNLWLQTAGESGLVGLCAMLWLWGWIILRAWRSRDAGALALLAAIFVINSVDYLFFYAPVHLAFWIAAVGLKRMDESPVSTSPVLLKPA